jgi:hypothetical protein
VSSPKLTRSTLISVVPALMTPKQDLESQPQKGTVTPNVRTFSQPSALDSTSLNGIT